MKHRGTLGRRFGYFHGSSGALEIKFGGSHRLQTDFWRFSSAGDDHIPILVWKMILLPCNVLPGMTAEYFLIGCEDDRHHHLTETIRTLLSIAFASVLIPSNHSSIPLA